MSSKRLTPIWQIGILFPDGKKIIKPRCTLDDIFDTYFLKLDKYLNGKYTAEELYNLYKKTYEDKGIKIQINFQDSWGYIWRGKEAWPKDTKFIDYLNKRLNE